MEKKTNIHIKPLGLMDLLAFKNLVPQRKKIFASGPATPIDPCPPANRLAASLHPAEQYMTVREVTRVTDDIISYTLEPDVGKGTKTCAYFRAGQYLSVKIEVDGHPVTRPVSISSSPADAMNGFYTLTVKRQDDGFVSPYIHEHWKAGTKVTVSAPEGTFFYEPLRDAKTVIGMAGGCGITPFRSMAKAIAQETEDFNLILLYGSRRECDIAFREEFTQWERESKGKFRAIHVISDEKPFAGAESGFITRALIEKYAPLDAAYSIFLCGPQAMYDFVDKEIASLGLKEKFIRRELYGEIKDVSRLPGYPAGTKGKTFTVKVHVNGDVRSIPASADESILTALERAKIATPSRCRSGECGYCRSRLIGGNVFIPEDSDGRRGADKKFGFIHPCSSYPLGDIEMELP